MSAAEGSGFSDDELGAFYRAVEARTAANTPPRRRSSDKHAPVCPTPDKDAYPTLFAAEEAIEYSRRHRRSDVVLRTYRCACGKWHITSKPDLGPKVTKPTRAPRRGKR